jgi:hypothetical protein
VRIAFKLCEKLINLGQLESKSVPFSEIPAVGGDGPGSELAETNQMIVALAEVQG